MKLVSVISWIFILIIGANFCESSKAPQHCYTNPIIIALGAKLDNFPFLAFLFKEHKQHEMLVAAGAILNKDWVLTTAHVLQSNLSHVHVGKTEEESPNSQEREVSKQLMHPKFSLKPRKNDIGLVKVSKPLDFNENVKVVPMNKNLIREEFEVEILVFGPKSEQHEMPKPGLHVLRVPTARNECCNVTESVFCAYTSKGMQDIPEPIPCYLDVGTLLLYKNSVAGLDLFGPPCYMEHFEPYTQVSLFTKWVETTMKEN